jgi:hypothetical protein
MVVHKLPRNIASGRSRQHPSGDPAADVFWRRLFAGELNPNLKWCPTQGEGAAAHRVSLCQSGAIRPGPAFAAAGLFVI